MNSYLTTRDEPEQLCLDDWGIQHPVEPETCERCPSLKQGKCSYFDCEVKKMFSVHTNEEEFVTDASENTIRKAMMLYIKQKKKEGLPLESIKFTYYPIKFKPAMVVFNSK